VECTICYCREQTVSVYVTAKYIYAVLNMAGSATGVRVLDIKGYLLILCRSASGCKNAAKHLL